MIRFTLLIAIALTTPLASAQTSELFLTSWQITQAYVVQNGQIIRQFQRTATDDGPALIVGDTVKMYGQTAGSVGREYDLNGNLLGGQYPNTGFIDCYDGASDGRRNWTISHNDFGNNFAVLVGDSEWVGVQIGFVPTKRSSGITYDATDDTLWVTNNIGGSDNVQHYTTSGSLLGEFPINMQSGGGYGIALDPADDTLWIPGAFGTQGLLVQYDKTGILLQTLSVPGLNTDVLGAEFLGAEPSGPVGQNYCGPANLNSTGLSAVISGFGSEVAAQNKLELTAALLPADKFGYFLNSDVQAFTPFPPGSQGNLCLGGGIGRHAKQIASSGPNGMLVIQVDLTALPRPGGTHAVIAGETWNFQCWFRDFVGGPTSNFTDGLSVTFL